MFLNDSLTSEDCLVVSLLNGAPLLIKVIHDHFFTISYYFSSLVGGLEHFLFSHILGIIIPVDVHIFQRGGPTTNQLIISLFFPQEIPLPIPSPSSDLVSEVFSNSAGQGDVLRHAAASLGCLTRGLGWEAGKKGIGRWNPPGVLKWTPALWLHGCIVILWGGWVHIQLAEKHVMIRPGQECAFQRVLFTQTHSQTRRHRSVKVSVWSCSTYSTCIYGALA